MTPVKNIIFDLGGVLLDIDPAKTNAAFEKLGIANFKNNYSLHKADSLFDDLETGKASELDFYNGIRNIDNNDLSNRDIEAAWNALLLDFRVESLSWIKQNASKYNFFLLSNTNGIHQKAFYNHFTQQTGQLNFDAYFTKAYYSHQIGLRKPNAAIYNFLLADAGIKAEESIFIDDLLKNIEAAAAAGLQTHHLLPHQRIENLGL